MSQAPSKTKSAAERVAERVKAAQAAEAAAAGAKVAAEKAVAEKLAAEKAARAEVARSGAARAEPKLGQAAKVAQAARAGKATAAPRKGRTLTVGPATIVLTILCFVATAGWAAVATGMLVFGDKLSAQLVAQQSDMQFAYEQKLVVFRAQLDRFARQARLERDGIEGRIADLMLRQAALEARQAMLTALADQTRAPEMQRLKLGEAQATPPPRSSFAILDATYPAEDRVAHVGASIGRVEQAQVNALTGLTQRSQNTLLALRTAFSDVGLDAEQMVPNSAPVRGAIANLVPGDGQYGGGPFEANVAQIRRTLQVLGRLRTASNAVPFLRPVAENEGNIVTSSFGTRSDPFTGEARFHAGLDFRAPTGVPVHAGGSGVVSVAGVGGGYGNLVIVDHGNGITTRYGHLSAINVTVGQPVAAGQIVGLVGSTGRSTGPHLHYETRIKDEPNDPGRFIRAGERIFARN